MISVRALGFADVEIGLRLKQENGWNQTVADWARFLALEPAGCFLAEEDGVPCGTVTTCVFGPVAWIGMMLVEKARRGRGIGRALMTHALEYVECKGVRTVRLDATPLGEPLYRQLGFVEQFALTRFEGEPTGDTAVGGVVAGVPEQFEAILALDRQVTNTDRRKLLALLLRERPEQVRVVERGGAVVGLATARKGARAWLIGPCVGTSAAGPLLLHEAMNRLAGMPCYLDVPVPNEAATALVLARGLRAQRPLLRMCRGEPVREVLGQLWASSGPEKG